MSGNVQSMFYVGVMPWHKRGVALKEPPNTQAAIKCAGLDWTVSKVKLYSEFMTPVEGHFGIMRNDTKEVLGVVKREYVPLQNSEAFSFFDPLLDDNFIEYETAGALGKGEIIWILAKIKDNSTFEVASGDNVDKYLLLSNSHDGKSSFNIKFTPIRVVCQNTLNYALQDGESTKVRHLLNMHHQLEDVQTVVAGILRVYQNIETDFKQMVKRQLRDDEINFYFSEMYPVIPENEAKTDSQRRTRDANIWAQYRLEELYETGYGLTQHTRGTMWAAYNAVTQHVDHPSNYTYGDDMLLKRIWYGGGDVLKRKAYNLAMEIMKAA